MDEDWILYSVTSFTFLVIFSFCYIRHVFTFFERNQIPSARYPTFPFGDMYDVIFQKTPMFMLLWKFYNRFKRKKYSGGGFYIFLKPAVLVMNPSERLLSPNSDCFINGNNYKLDVKISDKLLCKICETVPKIWDKLLSQIQETEQDVNFTRLTNHKFVDISAIQYFDLKTTENNLQDKLHALKKNNVFSICHTLMSLCYPTLFNQYFKRSDKIDKFYADIKDKNYKHQNVNEDFLQILLQNNVPLNEIREQCFMMLNNIKRSNNAVLFALYELSINKEIQEELREEIIRFRKINSDIDYNNLHKLTYLETVVCETLRKYPLEPFFYRFCRKNFSHNEITLPKDILMFVSTFGMHHDADNYINPESFDPDRFSEENIKFIPSRKYLPFGCRDQDDFDAQFMKVMMKMALIQFLSTFKLSLSKTSSEVIQFDEKLFNSLKFKKDLWLKIHRM